MLNRRTFIKSLALGTGTVLLTPEYLLAADKSREIQKLTILHTNDMHSHIEPFDLNDPKYPGLGGMAQRASLIKNIRQQEDNVLLLDAGDIFQGTPYFNIYGGELEFKLMSLMKYDASTIGNHDLDNGLDGLKRMMPHANFPFINANYDFKNTILNEATIPYKIFNKGILKIGVFGVGVELAGLVDSKNYGDTIYNDPIAIANKYANVLKNDEKCDLVICLSHLGYSYKKDKVSDLVMAKQTSNIDLIIGGHTHTFLDKPTKVKNLEGKKTLVTQAGWAGVKLGRVDFSFNTKKNSTEAITHNYFVGKTYFS
jgi:5'-nucleotidase